MIERIALYRLHPHVERMKFAAELRIALSSVSGLASLSVGLPSDASAQKSWDVSLVIRFADVLTAERALGSDAFVRCERELIEPAAQVAKSWAFALIP